MSFFSIRPCIALIHIIWKAGTYLSGHSVCVKDREYQSQDGPIEEAKMGLEDDAGGGRGGRCHQVDLVSQQDKS